MELTLRKFGNSTALPFPLGLLRELGLIECAEILPVQGEDE